jgi:hypothetical protein
LQCYSPDVTTHAPHSNFLKNLFWAANLLNLLCETVAYDPLEKAERSPERGQGRNSPSENRSMHKVTILVSVADFSKDLATMRGWTK